MGINISEFFSRCCDVSQASTKWKENTRDMSRQKVGSQLSAMNAATAQMVTLTSAGQDEPDYTAVGSAVQTM